MSASFFYTHFSRSSLPQRRIESDAERCFGRDRSPRQTAGGPFLTVAAMALHRFPSLALKSRIDARKMV